MKANTQYKNIIKKENKNIVKEEFDDDPWLESLLMGLMLIEVLTTDQIDLNFEYNGE